MWNNQPARYKCEHFRNGWSERGSKHRAMGGENEKEEGSDEGAKVNGKYC